MISICVMSACSRKVCVSMCRMCPVRFRVPILWDADESLHDVPGPRERFRTPMMTHPACVRAYHSHSPKLSAMGLGVERIIMRKCRPCIRMTQDVERRVLRHPLWSESLNARTCVQQFLYLQSLRHPPYSSKVSSKTFEFVASSCAGFTHEARNFPTSKTIVGSVFRKVIRFNAGVTRTEYVGQKVNLRRGQVSRS